MEFTAIFSHLLTAVAIVLVIVSWHVFLHYRRHQTEFLFIRTLFLIIGLVGLSLLFLRLSVSNESPAENIYLLTDNSELTEDQVNTDYKNSVHQILNSAEVYDTIIIHGNGLDKKGLSLLDSFHIQYVPPERYQGFTSIHLPIIKENEAWTLDGNVNQDTPQNLTLEQSDGKILETVSDSAGDFSFRLTSKSAGHYNYKLSILYLDTTITESLPVEILPSQKWNLIALSSAPSFELNYLKNYWVKLGNGFTLKQKVSNDRFKETFLNMPKISLENINSEILNRFNFLLSDANAWNELKDKEQKLILNYVAAGRIGLLFIGLEKGDKIENYTSVTIDTEKELSVDNIKFTENNPPSGFRKVNFKNVTPAAIRKYGLGTIGVMTLAETYRFILGDEAVSYQNLWARIFSELYIANSGDVVFKSSKWIWENEDCSINIFARKELDDTGILNNNTEVKISKTLDQKGMYSTVFKPRAGWNKLSLNNNKFTHRFYVHSTNTWNAMKQTHLQNINETASKVTRNIPKKVNRIAKPLPLYWGLILSLIGFGLLWLHERIYN